MATDAKVKAVKGFQVLCPYCGDAEARVKIDLNDLTGAEACSCTNCDSEFSVKEALAKLTAQLRRWRAVARWVETAAECLNVCGPAEGED